MSSRQGHSTRLGVALSLLLHGAALVLFLAFGPSPVEAPSERPLIVELVGPVESLPRPAPMAEAPETAPRPSEAGPRRPPRPGLPTTGPRIAADRTPPPASPSRPTPPTASSSREERGFPRAWFEAHGLGPEPRAGAPDLAARPGPAIGPGDSGGGLGEGSGPGVASPGTAARVATILRQAAGQARVRSSHHPAWSPLSERLLANFQPDWSLLEEGPQPTGLASTGFARMLPGYLEMASRYANNQRLSDSDGVMGERTSEAGKVTDRLAAAGSQSTTGLPLPVERFENPFQRRYVTLVEVAHRGDGSVTGIQLRQPCGHGAVDRLALAATRKAVTEVDPHAWAGQAQFSIWSFTATFAVLPPAPSFACPVDVAWTGRFDRCAYPLKKTSEGHVELLALE